MYLDVQVLRNNKLIPQKITQGDHTSEKWIRMKNLTKNVGKKCDTEQTVKLMVQSNYQWFHYKAEYNAKQNVLNTMSYYWQGNLL